MTRMKDKTVFITGAGAGIGRTTALTFAKEGAKIIATDINQQSLETLLNELKTLSSLDHTIYQMDVTDVDSIKSVVSQCQDVNVLFNCVGYVHEGTIADTSIDDWQRSFDINVTSMMIITKEFLTIFIKNGGASIINMSSVASNIKGIVNRFAYSTSKAAVLGLTKSIAIDYMADNIRVNAICPGTVDSPSLHDRINKSENPAKAWNDFIARQPIGRVGRTEEIASIALYLASDESAYTTGTWIVADGGITL